MLSPRSRHVHWRTIAVVALSVAGLSALAATFVGGASPVDAVDGSWISLGAGSLPVEAMNAIGSFPAWASIVLVCGFASGSGRSAFEALSVAAIAELVTSVIKVIVARPRPSGAAVTDIIAAGFPSGHVVRTAIVFAIVLALVPWGRRHPRLVIGMAIPATLLMGVARVSSGAHHSSDVIGALLIAATIVAVWQVVRVAGASIGTRVARSSRSRPPGRLSLIAVAAAVSMTLIPSISLAASPSPGAESAGDPRSSGQGPGLVGDPATAIVAVLAIGLASVAGTYLYVRLTPGRSKAKEKE